MFLFNFFGFHTNFERHIIYDGHFIFNFFFFAPLIFFLCNSLFHNNRIVFQCYISWNFPAHVQFFHFYPFHVSIWFSKISPYTMFRVLTDAHFFLLSFFSTQALSNNKTMNFFSNLHLDNATYNWSWLKLRMLNKSQNFRMTDLVMC